MNRRIVLPLIFVLVVILLPTVASASTEVGVTVGQSAEYTYAMSLIYRSTINGSVLTSIPYTVGSVENITIQEISGTNITLQSVKIFVADQTTETKLGWIDLSTGAGPAIVYIILANCNEGDLIYPNGEGVAQQSLYVSMINETFLMNYGDTTIEVNHANATTTVYNQTANVDNSTLFYNQTTTVNYYWEKATGLLIGYTECNMVEQENMKQIVYYSFQRVGIQQVFYPLIDSADYPVTVDSNSAILGFAFNQSERQISLYVSGVTETSGFCDFAIPNDLLWGTLSLNLDGSSLVEGVDYTQTNNSTHNIFQVTYSNYGTHIIDIVSSDVIPEFPTFILLPTFMIAAIVAAIIYRKKLGSGEKSKHS